MGNQKQSLGRLGLGVLCSLSESYMMLPFLIFSGLLTGKSTAVNFFLPVVVVYSVQRGCLIALRGFGEITNPYRILRGGLLLALTGAALMVLSALYQPLQMVSAVLIGVGLSSYRAMFLPVCAIVTEGNPALKKGKSVGSLLYFLVMLLALGLSKSHLPVAPALFLCYLAGALWLLSRLDGEALFAGRKAFDTAKRKPVYFVFGGLTLLCLLILRQYKQSGVSALIWLAPAVVAAAIVLELYRSWHYKEFTYQTYWAGALKCHLLVFSLVYHSSVGNTAMASRIYLAIALGSVLSALLRKPLARLLPGPRFNRVCMVLSAGCAFLLAVDSQTVNLLGILLSGGFANMVAAETGEKYMEDRRYVPLERPLVRLRIQTAGSVLQQLVIFFTIYLLGEGWEHQNLLEPYAAGMPNPSVGPLLRVTGLICGGTLLLSAILIACFAGSAGQPTEPVNERSDTNG